MSCVCVTVTFFLYLTSSFTTPLQLPCHPCYLPFSHHRTHAKHLIAYDVAAILHILNAFLRCVNILSIFQFNEISNICVKWLLARRSSKSTNPMNIWMCARIFFSRKTLQMKKAEIFLKLTAKARIKHCSKTSVQIWKVLSILFIHLTGFRACSVSGDLN